MKIRILWIVILSALSVSTIRAEPEASPTTLRGLLTPILEEHARIQTAQAEVDAEMQRIAVAFGGWYPELEIAVNAGNQQHTRIDTQAYFASTNIKLTQLLWDFGATNTAIEKARLKLLLAQLELARITQTFILDAASSYIDLIRSHLALEFSQQSEDNIRKQTGLEEAKVTAGAGYSTDVLQAKTQLAAANARLLRAQEAVVQAGNKFREFFGFLPDDITTLEPVTIRPVEGLPEDDLSRLLTLTRESNLDVQSEQIKFQLSQTDVSSEEYERFYPKIHLVVEQIYQENARSTQWRGEMNDFVTKVEIKMPFNLGFTAFDSVRAAELTAEAKRNALYDMRIITERKARSAFQKLITSRATAQSLQEQADIAAAFLDLARIERELGSRSLIDILSGEVSLINARSDTISAQYDAMLAQLSLLEVVGALRLEVFGTPLTQSTE